MKQKYFIVKGRYKDYIIFVKSGVNVNIKT